MGAVARPATEYRLTDEQRDLAAQYWGYALTVARRFGESFPEAAVDWDGAAALGLCGAARLYQPSSKKRFEKFLLWRVKGECMDEMRRMTGYRKCSRYLPPKPVPIVIEPAQTGLTVGWECDYWDWIEYLVRDVSTIEKRYVPDLFPPGGATQAEVARKHGKCPNRLFVIYHTVIDHMRVRLEAQGVGA